MDLRIRFTLLLNIYFQHDPELTYRVLTSIVNSSKKFAKSSKGKNIINVCLLLSDEHSCLYQS